MVIEKIDGEFNQQKKTQLGLKKNLTLLVNYMNFHIIIKQIFI